MPFQPAPPNHPSKSVGSRIDRIVSPLRPGNQVSQSAESLTGEARVKAAIFTLWQAMSDCIERGKSTEGILPGGLGSLPDSGIVLPQRG